MICTTNHMAHVKEIVQFMSRICSVKESTPYTVPGMVILLLFE